MVRQRPFGCGLSSQIEAGQASESGLGTHVFLIALGAHGFCFRKQKRTEKEN